MMLSWEICESTLLMLFDYVVCVRCCSLMCIEDIQFNEEDAYYWIFAIIQYTTHS
jgi:hypothetical protein